MDLLSLAATQSEHQPSIQPQITPYHNHHQRSSSASDLPGHHIYHHQRSTSLQHLNSGGIAMDAVSPTSGSHPHSASSSHPGSVSPSQQQVAPKNVSFELYFPESPQYRARLPMRVSIFPHDTTDSIATTVKNFYGLYSGPTTSRSISFEDEAGNTLIARYENFRNNMVVYVRVIDEPQNSTGVFGFRAPPPVGAQQYYNPEGYQQQLQHAGPAGPAAPARPDSQSSRRRSPSPGRGRRSTSISTNGKKGRSRSAKNRGPSSVDDNGYSSGDANSVSGKGKEPIGNTEISLDNIVEGNRRKRAKFESSELPLFAPPQMPATTSNPSVSPARRVEHHHRPSLPFVPQGQNPFANPPPLQSPQSYNNGFAQPNMYATPADRRSRGSIGYPGGAGGILPTPDPTVHSCMSEEDKDVALQLMRLGEMSNVSHGRTSASTLDDTFSGRADAASSTGATSDADSEGDEELPAPRKQKLDASGASRKVLQTTTSHFEAQNNTNSASGDEAETEGPANSNASKQPKPAPKPKPAKPRAQSVSKPKVAKPKAGRPAGASKVKKPSAPTSGAVAAAGGVAALAAPRKQSTASIAGPSLQPGEEETPDLSTKPRCQRCRKSKKGCDRQRPCGRCRDAGLGADQCISEDEGNGRKGRYGRHMGVPIKKEDLPGHQPALLPAAPIQAAPVSTTAIPLPAIPTDKSKKRKR